MTKTFPKDEKKMNRASIGEMFLKFSLAGIISPNPSKSIVISQTLPLYSSYVKCMFYFWAIAQL